MSAMSRRKGGNHEREIVNILKAFGHPCARNLDQTRDGGGDIPFGDFLIECKRRASIAIYPWWDQVVAACAANRQRYRIDPSINGDHAGAIVHGPMKKPLLVIRADKRENLVVMRLADFLELNPPSPAGRASLKGAQG